MFQTTNQLFMTKTNHHQPAVISGLFILHGLSKDCDHIMTFFDTTNCMDTMWVPIISCLDDLSVKIHWSMNIFSPGEMAMAYLVNQWKITIQI